MERTKTARDGTRPKNSASGVTLVEAIFALAILGIGIFVLVETTARCLAVIRVSRHYQTARAVLDLGELDYPMSATNTPDANAAGPVEYPGGFTFSRVLDPVDGEEGLFIVRTKVTWSETGKSSYEEVVSYFYCPDQD